MSTTPVNFINLDQMMTPYMQELLKSVNEIIEKSNTDAHPAIEMVGVIGLKFLKVMQGVDNRAEWADELAHLEQLVIQLMINAQCNSRGINPEQLLDECRKSFNLCVPESEIVN